MFWQFVDVEVFEKDVVSLGFRVEFINLSGSGVLDECDDELFWRVKDRLPGGLAVVVPPSVFYMLWKISWVNWIRRVWFEWTLAGRQRYCGRRRSLCVFRCIEVVQIIHRKWKKWVFQLQEIRGVVQSPGVLERSLDVCDVFIGNIKWRIS